MKRRDLIFGAAASGVLCTLPSALLAQFVGTGPRDNFRDTTILRPPAGSKVVLIVFEDLGCPACARAHPYEVDAVKQTHVTWLRYDCPLPAHIWTFAGAVCARYVQETYGPQAAEDFRGVVFKAQSSIASEDDIKRFLANWLEKRGKKMPANLDPTGKLAREVSADRDLAKRLNLEWTPTIVVATRNQYQVISGTGSAGEDPSQIAAVVKAAMAKAR